MVYLRDNGKVRLCSSNTAQMNLIEFIWYHKKNIIDSYKEAIVMCIEGLIALFAIMSSPILLLLIAYIMIRNAKREVKECE